MELRWSSVLCNGNFPRRLAGPWAIAGEKNIISDANSGRVIPIHRSAPSHKLRYSRMLALGSQESV